jgi:hypothetical protein
MRQGLSSIVEGGSTRGGGATFRFARSHIRQPARDFREKLNKVDLLHPPEPIKKKQRNLERSTVSL